MAAILLLTGGLGEDGTVFPPIVGGGGNWRIISAILWRALVWGPVGVTVGMGMGAGNGTERLCVGFA